MNRFSRSENCPWMSPHTVTGVDTGCTLLSSPSTSFTMSHSAWNARSGRKCICRTSSSHRSMFAVLLTSHSVDFAAGCAPPLWRGALASTAATSSSATLTSSLAAVFAGSGATGAGSAATAGSVGSVLAGFSLLSLIVSVLLSSF